MNANEVIESYVADVAIRLPRSQRNDVAFELRALLREELQGRAQAAGREADAAMATVFLNEFGRPAEVAARYRPPLAILDPADGRAFLRAAVIGLAILWVLGLVKYFQPWPTSGSDVLRALGGWWTGAAIPSLWWPGVLVVYFGIAAWTRRRWPETAQWKPRSSNRIAGGRAALALGIAGTLCGLWVLVDPRWLLDVSLGGRAAPAAYEALTYTEAFRQRLAPILFVILLNNVPVWIGILARGRWTPIQRRVQTWTGLVTCAVMAWAVLGGPIFVAPASDRFAKVTLVLLIGVTLLDLGLRLRRRVEPAPDPQPQA